VSVTTGYCERPIAASAVLQAECELSNDRKCAAKRVSELSSELFFAIFVRVTFHSFSAMYEIKTILCCGVLDNLLLMRFFFCWDVRLECPQGSYRPWKVLEFYCSEFQALETPGKRHRSWKVLELLTSSSGIFSSGLSSR